MLGLVNITAIEELDAALTSLNPERYLVQLQNLVSGGHGFGNNLMSCATDAEQHGALREAGEFYVKPLVDVDLTFLHSSQSRRLALARSMLLPAITRSFRSRQHRPSSLEAKLILPTVG